MSGVSAGAGTDLLVCNVSKGVLLVGDWRIARVVSRPCNWVI